MTPLKFKVINVNHSKQIQKALFDMGCQWPGDVNKIFHTDSKYLFVDEYGYISHGNDAQLYDEFNGEEGHVL